MDLRVRLRLRLRPTSQEGHHRGRAMERHGLDLAAIVDEINSSTSHTSRIWIERTRANDNKSAAQGKRTKRTNGHTPYKGVSASDPRLLVRSSIFDFSFWAKRYLPARICGQDLRPGFAARICGQDLRPRKPERGRGPYRVTPFVRSGLTQDTSQRAWPSEARHPERGEGWVIIRRAGHLLLARKWKEAVRVSDKWAGCTTRGGGAGGERPSFRPI